MTDRITWALRSPSLRPSGAASFHNVTHGVAETPPEYVVRRPKVYIDTSIPSYLTARPSRDVVKAKRQQLTQEWWALCRWQFDLYWSNEVRKEAQRGDKVAARRRLRALEPYLQLLLDPRSEALAETLMQGCRLPESARTDVKHMAIAAVHNTHFLLTWNHTHLANPELTPTMMDICIRTGYSCPHILTPEEIMRTRTHEQ